MSKATYRKLTFETVPLPMVMQQAITDIEILAPTKNGTRQQRILAVTSDPVLALSRALVLQRAGFHVIAVNTPDQVEAALDLGPFDVFVVGHPMTPTQREQVLGWLKGHSSDTPIVEIHGYGMERIAEAFCSVESSAGPAELVKSVQSVFGGGQSIRRSKDRSGAKMVAPAGEVLDR